MLTTIREKAQGAFAWLILIAITIPFALWGIQNYIDTGKEAAVASVGSKDFYQRDWNRAYEQYSQNFRGMSFDEQAIKAQALDKLIKDEVLLQYANKEGLVASDASAKQFIMGLPYFQTDGKFDEKRYKNLLSSQRMSTAEFVSRIKSALILDQFQRSVIDSGFATKYTIENYFKIQNQQRDIDYVTVPLEKIIEAPSDQDINQYYQQHQDAYKIPEQASIEYLELSLDELARNIEVNDDKLRVFYEEQKAQYTSPERRKISHILFAVKDKVDDKTALTKAQKALEDLKNKDFSALAAEVSDDKLTAKNGGDLGLFLSGSMEKAFEDVASTLKLNEISKPVRTAFGYHLIKVTELVPGNVKPFETVKSELSANYQKAQAENRFYELGEKLTEISYENPDSLQAAADALAMPIKKTGFFSKEKGEGIANDPKIRESAFSEDVLKGNNSSPIEIGTDKVVVLRMIEHKPSSVKSLVDVKTDVITAIQTDKAKQNALAKAEKIKQRLQQGEDFKNIATELKLDLKTLNGLKRSDNTLPEQIIDGVFGAAKPVSGKITALEVALNDGQQVVVSLKKVNVGAMSEDDKKRLDLAQKNLAKAFGEAEFNSLLSTLQTKADVIINKQIGKE
jgi:peptidyl-prolyl cis-trans isomerase D